MTAARRGTASRHRHSGEVGRHSHRYLLSNIFWKVIKSAGDHESLRVGGLSDHAVFLSHVAGVTPQAGGASAAAASEPTGHSTYSFGAAGGSSGVWASLSGPSLVSALQRLAPQSGDSLAASLSASVDYAFTDDEPPRGTTEGPWLPCVFT